MEQFEKIIDNNKMAVVDLKEALVINKSEVVQMNSSQVDSWFSYFQALLPYLIGTIVICGVTYYIYYNVFSGGPGGSGGSPGPDNGSNNDPTVIGSIYTTSNTPRPFVGIGSDDALDKILKNRPPIIIDPIALKSSNNRPTVVLNPDLFHPMTPELSKEFIASKIADGTLTQFKSLNELPFKVYKVVDPVLSKLLAPF
jgi:hypothetical protein